MPDDTSMTSFKPRPTVYNGIKMRSRLEAGFAQWLDQRHLDWQYEPECFASGDGQYVPDFLVNLGRDGEVYIECKPYSHGTNPDDPQLGSFNASMTRWAAAAVSLLREYRGRDFQAGERSPSLTEVLGRMEIILASKPDAALAITWPTTSGDLLVSTPVTRSLMPSIGSPWVAALWVMGTVGSPDPTLVYAERIDRPWSGEWWSA